MKKLYVLIAVALLLVGFVYYTLFITPAHELANRADESAKELSENATTTEKKPVVPERGKGTLESLMTLGVPMECTIKQAAKDGALAVEGTYFVAGDNMRGDFITNAPEVSEPVLSSMIISKDEMYVWSEMAGIAQGVKMPKAELTKQDGKSNAPVGFNAEVDYECKPWPNVDNSVFLPPTKVTFRDMNEIMQAGMEYGTIYEEGEMMPNQ